MIVELCGEIGSEGPTADELVKSASEKHSTIAILDLSKAKTINSKGLEWLEQVTSSLEPSGVKVRVVTPEGSKVRRILRLMKFDRFVLVLASVLDAVTFGRRRRQR